MPYIYAHARLDDLDLDARSQWVGKGTALHAQSRQLNLVSKIKITLATTTVGLFYFFYVILTSTLQAFIIWLVHLVSWVSSASGVTRGRVRVAYLPAIKT